jgi:Uma2 family endonuclease
MSTAVISPTVANALQVIETLEEGECKTLHDVSWEEYEELLAELGDWSAKRIAYTEGELEIMAPLYRHEKPKDLVLLMVAVLAEELGGKWSRLVRLRSSGKTCGEALNRTPVFIFKMLGR